jgi:hypothetical protein
MIEELLAKNRALKDESMMKFIARCVVLRGEELHTSQDNE